MLSDELLIVVGARLNSSRLPKKHLLNLAGKPLIHRLVERLALINAPHSIIIATTNDDYNQPLVSLAAKLKISCLAYDGNVDNLVGRIDVAVKNSTAKYIAYICGDCPLVEPTLIDSFYQALRQNEMANYTGLQDTRKSIHEGIAVYSRKGWQQLVASCETEADYEHVGLSLKKLTNLASQTAYVEENDIYFTCDHRISVDTQADYQFMSAIYERWYQQNDENSIVPLTWVIALLKQESSLKLMNQKVMQKAAEHKYQKVTIVTEAGTDKGLGQLTRCLNLSQVLQENHGFGTEIFVLADEVPQEKLQLVNHKVFNCEASLLQHLNTLKDHTLLFDLFPCRLAKPEQWQQVLADLAEKNQYIFGIDRCAEWQSNFDHIWIPSFYCKNKYLDNISYGWQYYMVKPIERYPRANQLLILTGGSDALNYGNWLPKWLDDNLPEHIQPIWLQGPYAEEPNMPTSPKLKWQLSTASEELPGLMSQAEFVLTVYGVTLFEALASKIPTIVLPSVPLIAQDEYDAFSQQALATCLTESFTKETSAMLFSAFDTKFNDDSLQQIKLIGQGLKNISSEIAELIKQSAN